MADVRISNLPIANEIWNLNEVLPVVNSGSTTTSKRTYGSLFSNHSGGTYTITATDQTWAVIASSSSSPNTHIRIGGINNAAVISSRGANISSGQMNTIIGCEQDSDSSQPHINGGQYNTIIGSKGGVQTNGNHQAIINSTSSNIQGGEKNLIAAAQGFNIGSNCQKAAGIGVEAGGWDGPRYSFAGGGYQLTCTNDGGNDHGALAYNGLTFDGTNKGGYLYKVLGAAVQTCTIENDISAMIAASGRTTVHDRTLHTDNVHIYGTESKATTTGVTATGAVNVDLSLGSAFEFTITGNITSITFTNWREGGIYEFAVYNNGSYTITASGVTLDGISGSILARNGALNPTNNGYTFYRMMIIDGKGWLNEHLNFQAL